METYTYRARGGGGEILEDQMEGRDREAVAEILRSRGLTVINVERRRPGRRILSDYSNYFEVSGVFRSVGHAELVVFTRQLATMVEAGVPLVRALRILSTQTESSRLAEVTDEVRREVESGSSLSEALERRVEVFGRLYGEMVRAGEFGGVLEDVLLRIAAQLEKDQELRRRVRGAMTYPVFILAFALVAALFMLAFVVPIFARMYEDLGGTLPLPTRVSLFLSDAVTGPFGLLILALALGIGYYLRRRISTPEGRRAWAGVALSLPFGLGGLVGKVALARCSRTLGALVGAGVPILKALEVAANSSGNPLIEEALLRGREAVRQGVQIHTSLERETVFPPMVTRMVAVGEETGNLDGMLSKVADFYESEVDNAVRSLTSIIEPAMILVVGAIVGSIIISMYLPMFRIFELIK